jgi:Caspase domain
VANVISDRAPIIQDEKEQGMNNRSNGKTNLYALLIGVDRYLPNRLPGGYYYPTLAGCVRDIKHVQDFLERKLGLPSDRILKLTATDQGGDKPAEPPEQWPTRRNMIAAFNQLTERAQSGDQVYIHYSGHGARATTAYPNLKGANGVDEGLVPTDIGTKESNYIRDLELATLLKRMVEKGLIVTIVLDSCHSGGATRGASKDRVRGIGEIDRAARQSDNLVASPAEIEAMWPSSSKDRTRGVEAASGWLPEPEGYVLLAACRASESAYEHPFVGNESNGALSYWLLDSLKNIGPGYTYKQLQDRILGKIHTMFAEQTPQLEGDANRTVFGSDHVEPQPAVDVLDVNMAKKQVRLNIGQAGLVGVGAEFAIYPSGTTDFSQLDRRLAIAKITGLGASDSVAELTTIFAPPKPIDAGALAVLLEVGAVDLVRQVSLAYGQKLPSTIDQDAALEKVEELIKHSAEQARDQGRISLVELAGQADTPDYQVAVNENGEYEIWDTSGKAFANIRPLLKIDDIQAPARIVQRLEHLAKYHSIQHLDNYDDMSPLAHKLKVELGKTPRGFQPGQKAERIPFDEPGNTPTVKLGEYAILWIKNISKKELNVAVLDLGPDWSVSQAWPTAESTESIEPGEDRGITLSTILPAGYPQGTDVLKVFATVGPADFHWLEMPSLDEKPQVTRGAIRPRNALEALMAKIAQPTTRGVSTVAAASEEWATAQVALTIVRSR